MISNGYKVIGIEENGNVEYDVMSSCPVSPSKPKFDGFTQKPISKELQEAIKQLLSSHHSSFTVLQSAPTPEFDADFKQILANKRNEQRAVPIAANDETLDLDFSVNCESTFDANANEKTFEHNETTRCADESGDDLKNSTVDGIIDKPIESSLKESDFLALFSSQNC